jgi:hypothetical protein
MSNPLCDDHAHGNRNAPSPLRSVAVPATATDKHSGAHRTTLPQILPHLYSGRGIFAEGGRSRRPAKPHGLARPCRPSYHLCTALIPPSYRPCTGGVPVSYRLSTLKKGLIPVNTTLQPKTRPQNQNSSMNHHQKGGTAPLPATICGSSQGSNPPLKNSKPARIGSQGGYRWIKVDKA